MLTMFEKIIARMTKTFLKLLSVSIAVKKAGSRTPRWLV